MAHKEINTFSAFALNDQEVGEEPNLLGLPTYIADLELVKAGGMGVVYKGRHKVTAAKLAIKVLLPHLIKDITNIHRFVQESRLICTLSHPSIVSVYDCGVSGKNTPYIVMEFVDGITLRTSLEDGSMDVETGLTVFDQVARALSHAHKRGIIHRDIKPDNIMISRDDDSLPLVKVVDFGIAKAYLHDNEDHLSNLTQTGDIVGTPYYMSPEQAMGHQLDQRCDIYSLGCVMYHVFTGDPPFTGGSVIQILAQHAKDPVPDLMNSASGSKLPEPVKRIILKCLEKEPSDRYASMDGLIADLDSYRSSGNVQLSLTGKQKRSLRSMVSFFGSMVAGFVIVFVLVFGFEYVMKLLGGS
jgi:eukaryotic-like serine/threonine-protein kinase